MKVFDIDEGKLKKIYVVPYSHHDYAYKHERQWHIMRYIQIFNEVLDWLDKTPNAIWMIDNVVHSLLPFLENCLERIDQFKKYVTEGRIEIASGGYSLARPSYVGEESFVRNMVAGNRFFSEYFGVDQIHLFNNVDTASGQSNLPQILTLGGYKYYRFCRPEETLNQKKVPRTFYWKGLDGTKILVARGSFGGFIVALYTNFDFETQWPEIRDQFYKEELSPRCIEGLCPVDIEMLSYGSDDGRPSLNWYDRQIKLIDFMNEWNRREKTEIEFSTAHEYFSELEQYDLPVYEGRLDEAELSFNLPVKGANSFWRKRGELDKLLVRLENIAVIASFMGVEYPLEEIKKLWYQLFEITGHAIDWLHRQDNDTLMNIAINTLTKATIMMNEYIAKISHRVAYRQGMCNVVVNSQSFDRYEVVNLYITSPTGMRGFKLMDADGENLKYQVIRKNTHYDEPEEYRRFDYTSVDVALKVKVPAFGYNTIFVVPDGESTPQKAVEANYIIDQLHKIPSVEGDFVINNGVMELTFNKGGLRKLVHLGKGRTIKAGNSNSIYKVRFVKTPQNTEWMTGLDNLGEQEFEPTSWKVTANGPVMWKYRVHGKVASAEVSLDIIVKQGVAGLDFNLVLDHQPASDGYFIVDFQSDSECKVFSDVFFGVEQRDTSNQKHFIYETTLDGQIYGRNFTMFESGRLPVALVSENCSVYYFHDNKRNYMSLFLSRVMLHEYSNEEWFRDTSEDFRLGGRHDFKFSLFIAEETGRFDDVQRYVKSLHHPLQSAYKTNKNSDGAVHKKSFISSNCTNVVQSAIYFENGYYFARFFESCGKASKLCLSFSEGIDEYSLTDFNGEVVSGSVPKIDEAKQSVMVDIGPWQIITLKFKPV